MSPETTTTRKKLDSWKEIAEYIGRDVRTAMRWESEMGLPVRRVPGGKRRAVFGLTDEIDAWIQARGKEIPEPLSAAPNRRTAWGIALAAAVCVLLIATPFFLGHLGFPKTTNEVLFKLPNKSFRFDLQTVLLKGSNGQVQVADLNGDGYPDIVIGGATTGNLAVLINQNGTLHQPRYFPSCIGSQSPVAGDFDGDGKVDIAVTCTETNELEIWWGDGKGSFSNPKRWKTGNLPTTTASADLNRDGIADIVVGSGGGGPLVVFFGGRDRELLRKEFSIPQPNGPVIIDLDGDGISDVVVGSVLLASDQFFFIRGHGDGTFDEPRSIPAGCHAWRVAAADFTGDGIPDLVGSSPEGDVTIARGKGSGLLEPPSVVLRTPSLQHVWPFATQEKNYVLNLQYFPAVVRLIEFNKQGVPSISNDVTLPQNAHFVATGDFNRDGLTDIAVLSYDDNGTELKILFQHRD
jgi:hypothetical protein